MKRNATMLAIVAFGLAWIALPAVALADDCSSWSPDEVATCPNYAILKVLGFLAGAILATGTWLFNRYRDSWDETKRFFRPFTRDPLDIKPPAPPYRGSRSYGPDDFEPTPPGVPSRDYQ